jgi:hypothetical protein
LDKAVEERIQRAVSAGLVDFWQAIIEEFSDRGNNAGIDEITKDNLKLIAEAAVRRFVTANFRELGLPKHNVVFGQSQRYQVIKRKVAAKGDAEYAVLDSHNLSSREIFYNRLEDAIKDCRVWNVLAE